MAVRKEYKFTFTYDVNGNDEMLLETDYCYWQRNDISYYDHITITESQITVTGKRGKVESIQAMLSNIYLPLYEEFLRALIFIYFTTGKKFNYGDMSASYDDVIIESIDRENMQILFQSELPESLRLRKEDCNILFQNTNAVDELC